MNPVFLQNREWLIEPEALRSMVACAEQAGGRDVSSLAHQNHPLLTIEEGIASVSIEGPILRKPDIFARIFMGATDSEEVGAAIREASERDDVKAVLLDIDSPGGTVTGTPELAAAVSALRDKKPVYAFSSGLMCSAAYWIASQAQAIHATPSARIGSIGVVQTAFDNSARLHAAGIKVEVFAVGKYKTMGAPGTSLNDEQRELIRSNLAETAGEFHAAVLSRGRAIPAEAMEGQSFSGRQAQRFNLAGMVPDRTEAMRRLRLYHGSVDTGSRSMSDTLEDQLAEASSRINTLQAENTNHLAQLTETRSQMATLQSEHQAQADLLSEASTQVDSLRGQTELLAAEIDSFKGERNSSKTEAKSLQTKLKELTASQADFDKRVQTEVARVVASTGTTMPVRVTPAGDQSQASDLYAQFSAITDPTEQTAFWRKLTPDQQALILKHQA